jgi:RNA polymerase sigma-70 factor, ECF subfamily
MRDVRASALARCAVEDVIFASPAESSVRMTVATESVSPPLADATFDALYRAEFGRVSRIACRIVGDQAEAEDVAQEIFAALARRPDALDPNVPAWLHATAVRRALDAARSRHRRSAREERAAGRDPAWRDDDADPLEMIVRAERVSAIRAIMRRLKARDAALLAMRYGGDLSYREIAEALAVPPEHVGPLLARARRAFAREVHRAPRALILALATAVVVLLTLSALPPVRAFATDVAQRLHFAPVMRTPFRPGGMLFIGTDLQRLTAMTFRMEPAREPGFRVRIPAQLDASLRSTQRVDVAGYRVHQTYRLDSARARAAGMTVPRDLDGATIDIAIGPFVNVDSGRDPEQIDRPVVAVSEVATPVVVVTHTTARRIADWIAHDRTVPNGLDDVLRGLSDPLVALPLPKPFDRRFPRRGAQHVHVDGVEGIAASGGGSSYVAWIKHGVVYVAGGHDTLDRVLAVANSLH